MEERIDAYFNTILRNHLKYPETFQIQFFSKSIVLLPSEGTDTNKVGGTERSLLRLIKKDVNFKKNLIDTLQSNLGSIVELRSRGTDIIINLKKPEEPEDEVYTVKDLKDVGVYANIAKNLNQKQLQDFCRNNQEFSNMCRNKHFWIQLIKERFPEMYKGPKDLGISSFQYRWKEVYLGLLMMQETVGIKEVINYLSGITDENAGKVLTSIELIYLKFWDTFDYLILEDIIDVDKLNIGVSLMYVQNPNSIKHILQIKKINSERLYELLPKFLGYSEMVKMFTNYRGVDKEGNKVKFNRNEFLKNSPNSVYNTNALSIESYKIWYDLIGGKYDTQSILAELYKFYGTIPNNIRMYLLNKLYKSNPNPRDIVNWMVIYSMKPYLISDLLMDLWEKYRYEFTENEVNTLISNVMNNNRINTAGKENLLNNIVYIRIIQVNLMNIK
jgi:hypothetical protein